MTRDATVIDWAALADLPALTVDAGDLELVELVQRGLVTPRLRLTHAAAEAVGDADSVVIKDAEATPLLLGRAVAGVLEVETLRTVAPVDMESLSEADGPADLAVVAQGVPTASDLARLDALIAPRSTVLWLALAGRSRIGRQLLGDLPEAIRACGRGSHRIVRVPWPDPGARGLFERPRMPTPSGLARAYRAKHFIVVGERPEDAVARTHRGGTVIFLTGLSGSGKSTIAKALRNALEPRTSREVTLLDGDDVRRMLSAGLGFDAAGREANVRRTSWVAALLARHGGIAITALIAPFAEGRAEAARMARQGADFLEVWISTPLAECERRDRKGLYARARSGELTNFTGIDSPYEAPENADLVIDTTTTGVDDAVALILAELRERALRRGDDLTRRATRLVDAERDEQASYDI